MAAYPAVNSLIQTLELFQSSYPTLIHGQTAEMIDSLRASAEYFQNILESTNRHQKHEFVMFKDLEVEMRVVVQQAENLLESNIAKIMRKRQKGKTYRSKWTFQDEAGVLLWGLPQAIDKVDAVRAKVIKNSTSTINATVEERFFEMREFLSPNCVSTALLQEDTVELDDDSTYIIDQLLGSSPEREVITIWGLGGSGKATLARKVQDDPTVRSRFSIHAWVTISQEFQFRQVLLKLVRCITGNEFQEMSNDQLMDKSYKALKSWRYLIVIDDVWSTEIWDVFSRVLPEDRNGSRIILTTRNRCVAMHVNSEVHAYQMMPLSLYDSWKLLHKKLFGVEQNCPAELEEIGRAIVGKCEGLPLAILVVAGHLSKVPVTKETRAIAAKNVNRVVASDPEGRMALFAMGYHYLPIHLKPCFLHIGTFPRVMRLMLGH
ncbi:hypothetical protein R3W88_003293 [Solanum pinnatisectum]|uniref:NB-ARC domain-containing protein n=1 Tax=Solanum pinnatisectum TaxID=50273 RepID=A0AAV9MNX2_9SOLN|nr:hypothetical protein R3W88_003293 [Solanum pinnatisectum]